MENTAISVASSTRHSLWSLNRQQQFTELDSLAGIYLTSCTSCFSVLIVTGLCKSLLHILISTRMIAGLFFQFQRDQQAFLSRLSKALVGGGASPAIQPSGRLEFFGKKMQAWNSIYSKRCQYHRYLTAMGARTALFWLNACVPSNSYVKLNPQCDSIRRWGLWEVIRVMRADFTNGISDLIKETPREFSSPFCHMRTPRERTTVCKPEGSPH